MNKFLPLAFRSILILVLLINTEISYGDGVKEDITPSGWECFKCWSRPRRVVINDAQPKLISTDEHTHLLSGPLLSAPPQQNMKEYGSLVLLKQQAEEERIAVLAKKAEEERIAA